MSRTTCLRLAVALLLLMGGALPSLSAQSATKKETGAEAAGASGPKVKRVVFEIQHGVAKDLADLLGKLFKGEPGVQALAAPSGNALVLSAPAEALDDMIQLLKRLDRRPRMVTIEVLVAEVLPQKGEAGKPAVPAKELDPRAFTGKAEAAVAHAEELQKKGVIGELKRFRLNTAENQLGSVQDRVSKPYTVSLVRTGAGNVQRSISYRDIGTTVKATPQIGEDRRIVLDLQLSESRMRAEEEIVLGIDENGAQVRATTFLQATFEGKVTVRSGMAAVAEGVTTQGKGGQHQTLVIVTARVAEPEAKAGKQ